MTFVCVYRPAQCLRSCTVAVLIAVGILLSGMGCTPSRAASGPVDLTRYVSSVHAVRLRLDAAASASSPSPTTVRTIQSVMRRMSHVRLPGGPTISTDMAVLAGHMDSNNTVSIRETARQLDALDGALHRVRHRASSSRDLKLLDAILADSVFHPHCAPLDCIEQEIGNLLERLFSHASGVNPALGIVEWILVGLGGAGIICIALFLSRGVLQRLVADTIQPVTSEDTIASAREAQENAQREAARGRYRDALHFLFLYTILSLQERGLLHLRPGLTNREVLRSVTAEMAETSSGSAVRTAFADLVDAFDRVWYGHEPLTAAGYQQCEVLSRDIMEATERLTA